MSCEFYSSYNISTYDIVIYKKPFRYRDIYIDMLCGRDVNNNIISIIF